MPILKTPNNRGKKLEYTFKSDVLFKMLFVKYPDLLKRLVAVLLGIPLESIKDFQTINTEMPPEEIGKKFCRLDMNMIVDGKRVNIEIQIENEGNYPERSMFHWAKMFVSALPSSDNYSLLPKAIVISILGFKQFDCDEVHSEFAPMEINRHEILSDKQRYYLVTPKNPVSSASRTKTASCHPQDYNVFVFEAYASVRFLEVTTFLNFQNCPM